MDQIMVLKILEGRKAVGAYREAHIQLYSKSWHGGIPEEHAPLLNELLAELGKQGFNSLQRFWDTSEELNIQELGFISKEDFCFKATEADHEALERKWR